MSLIIQQNIQQLIETSSPEQKLLWEQIRLHTGENAAIRKLYYIGGTAGTEFAIYSANKLYLAYRVIISRDTNAYAGVASAYFWNFNNTAALLATNGITYWDATAAAPRGSSNLIIVENIAFSRLAFVQYSSIMFTGFRIDY